MQVVQQESSATHIEGLEEQVQCLQQEKAALQKQVTLFAKRRGSPDFIQNLPLGPAAGFWARTGCLEQGRAGWELRFLQAQGLALSWPQEPQDMPCTWSCVSDAVDFRRPLKVGGKHAVVLPCVC